MKPRTHDRIAGIAAAQADFSPLERHLFCLGAAIPDYLPTQFLHRHFYQKSADYVLRKLQKYSGRTSLFALFRLGELTHYMSDFCCSVHRSGGIGNPRLHLSYERQMQRYFMENLDLFTAENRMMQIPQTVTEVLQTYYRQPSMDFHTDLSAAIQASLVVCKKYALLVQQKQAFSGGVPNGSCHSGI